MEGADRVEVTLANEGLHWLDHPLLQVDSGSRCARATRPTRSSRSSPARSPASAPSFPSGGMPTLTVVAHDFLQRLTTGTKDRAFHAQHPLHR